MNTVDMDYLVLVFGLFIGFAVGWYARIAWVGVWEIGKELLAMFRRVPAC